MKTKLVEVYNCNQCPLSDLVVGAGRCCCHKDIQAQQKPCPGPRKVPRDKDDGGIYIPLWCPLPDREDHEAYIIRCSICNEEGRIEFDVDPSHNPSHAVVYLKKPEDWVLIRDCLALRQDDYMWACPECGEALSEMMPFKEAAAAKRRE